MGKLPFLEMRSLKAIDLPLNPLVVMAQRVPLMVLLSQIVLECVHRLWLQHIHHVARIGVGTNFRIEKQAHIDDQLIAPCS